MQGPTHRRGGELAALIGSVIMMRKGILIEGIQPIIQFIIIYAVALYGSKWSDLDHHRGSIPFKDALSLFMWKILHLTTNIRKRMDPKSPMYGPLGIFDAKHRSKQTHSDLTLVVFLFLTVYLSGSGTGDLSNQQALIRLLGIGFSLGILAHLILDMITPEGCWSMVILLINRLTGSKLHPKISFVPKRKYFATGGRWEEHVNRTMTWMSYLLLAWFLIEAISGVPIEIYILQIRDFVTTSMS